MVKDIRLLAFDFTKINAEKFTGFSGKLDIKSNIDIKSLEKIKPGKQEALKIKFTSSVDYGKLGKIELEGNIFITADSKSLKETASSWKDKKQPTELQLAIVNLILQKASIKAIQIEEEIGLPIHLQNIFPRVQSSQLQNQASK
jgi:hypothetical protein